MTWTLDRIRLKCVCDAETGCWLWQGGMLKARYPIAQEPAPELQSGQRQFYVRRKIFELTDRCPPETPAKVLTVRCKEPHCVAPDHLVVRTKSRVLRESPAASQRGLASRALMSRVRSRGSRISDEEVAQVRGSTEPLASIAGRLGISVSYAGALRQGKARIDYSSPFAALLAAPTARARP